MSKKWFRRYYKCPRTRNEARQNQEGWCRPKRRPAHLADAWDDKSHCIQNTWKVKRKTQYRVGKRGQKHTFIADSKIRNWVLPEYFDKHDIPYRIEPIYQSYMCKIPIQKKIIIGKIPKYVIKYIWEGKKLVNKQKHQIGYKDIVEWKTVGYKEKQVYYVTAYRITWWSDKDIGLEYILSKV